MMSAIVLPFYRLGDDTLSRNARSPLETILRGISNATTPSSHTPFAMTHNSSSTDQDPTVLHNAR
ncbi:hypothetical protein N7457_005568 [Penicillium paradoxum]|uniref:uncharacterized protein n=1 Tax=Penicillium paradoxum TaxID=176176 RepID=UPI0025477358|nr:uncharacterized protein N7457_005568 [Penicillium paradoxum]KAJ5780408.1 hypothetical protein N7457_005568 [Penicillium paradoxum]